jgi:peroxiredoxin
VQEHHEAIRRLGGEVLAVSFTPPAKAAAYLARHPLPFPVVTDPTRAAYRTFDLGRTTWRSILSGGVLWGYLKLIFRGWRPQEAQEGEDVMQLGGDFVLDAERRLVYGYRSRDPTDRPAVEELLRALRSIRP